MFVQKIGARELEIYKDKMREYKDKMVLVEPPKESAVNTVSPVPRPPLTKQSSDMTILHSNAKKVDKDNTIPTSTPRNVMAIKDSFAEFSFHPVSTSFWKKYKKSAKSGMRRSSLDASSSSGTAPKRRAWHTSDRNKGRSTAHKRFSYSSPTSSSKIVSPDNKGRSYVGIDFDQGTGMTSKYEYHSIQMELENEMDTFLSRMGQDLHSGEKVHSMQPAPLLMPVDDDALGTVDFTSDDAVGLMKALL